ncbi:unnamed protein product [Haemonchus placei]|uniref:Uncharacterized protein n=1 Tax=Haemonchus placei TaxID=6290 RepID=A0A0N4XBC0_HAEPC|nr:unnamed protein product [Haemonchus placei]
MPGDVIFQTSRPRSDGIEESKSPVRRTDETAEASVSFLC